MADDANAGPIRSAFESAGIRIPIAKIEMLHSVPAKVRRSSKYARITASIREVGVIEPPVVARHPSKPGRYLLLDGHLRIAVLEERGDLDVVCLIATDDEAFTYNKRINRLAIVQEHRMILKAIEDRVPEDRIARALNIDINTLRQKKKLLHGVCPEAVEILTDKSVSSHVFAVLKKMVPMRQIEAVELMVAMDRYTESYARALLAATPQTQLVPDAKPKQVKGLSHEQMALMERESGQLNREMKVAEQSYGADHLHLVLARGYLARLLGNARVVRYLAQQRPEFLAEFQKIAEMDSVAA
ncbi:plasmid partitioning protein RepB C-terminal domain-containing protein [Falsiroseomonas tokyonensis]|uniref:Plasmid partitioning protein RepB C-terminal domain-containing protein n=1 Tax=Falsiroseomonas tokyonensis TaxID=430521 RepID=A0ABV7C131_9PROT|nr:plasmid partitioning protein RepB C-terminal domain-containing protein [Falsiroseomonas tokyonensis]MBU8541505.1 ParB N-terminal domain-containing protein [Falsiroseomonas tokyonensis]